MKFRKKPVVIEAVSVNDALLAAWEDLPDWLEAAYERGEVLFCPTHVEITTLEGTMKGDRGDWIICGVQGELYPCKPEIFDETYEPVL